VLANQTNPHLLSYEIFLSIEPESQVQQDGAGFGKSASRDPIALVKAPVNPKKGNILTKRNKPRVKPNKYISFDELGGGLLQRPNQKESTYTMYSAEDLYYTEMFD
jgi:hypothetical protein